MAAISAKRNQRTKPQANLVKMRRSRAPLDGHCRSRISTLSSIASTRVSMGAITIRNLDDAVIAAIKRRAAGNGVSMEEEIRRLLASTFSDDRQERGREWARRQVERLNRGELPVAELGAAEEIRAMRRERTDHLERVSKDTE